MKEAGLSKLTFLVFYVHAFFSTKHNDSTQLAAMPRPFKWRTMNVSNPARVEWSNILGKDTFGNEIERIESLFDRLPFLFGHFDISRTEWCAASILDGK